MTRRLFAQTADMETTARHPIYSREKPRRILACSLLFFLFSFLGWVFEKSYFYFAYGVNADRGFLTLPFCTVYGSALLFIRLVLGLPKLGDPYPRNALKFLAYSVLAALIATAVELSTGLFFEQVFHTRLWTYRGYAHVYQDYICLPVSIGWGTAIGVGMAGVWSPLERVLMRAPEGVLVWGSGLLTLAIVLDFLLTAYL